jgi:hypothetical protein
VRKTFLMTNPPHKPARVVEAIKSDIRKYVKRERRKDLPKGADFWDFDCRLGQSRELAKTSHVEELVPAIDLASSEGWPEIYIEILAKTGHRTKKESTKAPEQESENSEATPTIENEPNVS